MGSSLIFVYRFCVNTAFTFFNICYAVHASILFQFTFADAPCFVVALFTPGGTLFVRLPGAINM